MTDQRKPANDDSPSAEVETHLLNATHVEAWHHIFDWAGPNGTLLGVLLGIKRLAHSIVLCECGKTHLLLNAEAERLFKDFLKSVVTLSSILETHEAPSEPPTGPH